MKHELPGIFLSARWKHLLMLNYAVEPSFLKPYLPAECELDFYEDKPYVSLVAFQFFDTKVWGVRWPGFVNFPELNLRFYVRYRGQRGVCFIREYVPSMLVAGLARVLYNEPYKQARMTDGVQYEDTAVRAEYGLQSGRFVSTFRVLATNTPFWPDESSREHFFKEHNLGVGRDRSGRTVTYNVEHPNWRVFPIEDVRVKMDAAGLYGQKFAFLGQRRPDSVVFAEGSEIFVLKKNPR